MAQGCSCSSTIYMLYGMLQVGPSTFEGKLVDCSMNVQKHSLLREFHLPVNSCFRAFAIQNPPWLFTKWPLEARAHIRLYVQQSQGSFARCSFLRAELSLLHTSAWMLPHQSLRPLVHLSIFSVACWSSPDHKVLSPLTLYTCCLVCRGGKLSERMYFSCFNHEAAARMSDAEGAAKEVITACFSMACCCNQTLYRTFPLGSSASNSKT